MKRINKRFLICLNLIARNDLANDGKGSYVGTGPIAECKISGCSNSGRCIIAKDNETWKQLKILK